MILRISNHWTYPYITLVHHSCFWYFIAMHMLIVFCCVAHPNVFSCISNTGLVSYLVFCRIKSIVCLVGRRCCSAASFKVLVEDAASSGHILRVFGNSWRNLRPKFPLLIFFSFFLFVPSLWPRLTYLSKKLLYFVNYK